MRLAQLVVVVVTKEFFHLLPVPGPTTSHHISIQDQPTNPEITRQNADFTWALGNMALYHQKQNQHYRACIVDTVSLLLPKSTSNPRAYNKSLFTRFNLRSPGSIVAQCPTLWRPGPTWLFSWTSWNAVAEHVPKIFPPHPPGAV